MCVKSMPVIIYGLVLACTLFDVDIFHTSVPLSSGDAVKDSERDQQWTEEEQA